MGASVESDPVLLKALMTAVNPITYVAGFLFGISGLCGGLGMEYSKRINER